VLRRRLIVTTLNVAELDVDDVKAHPEVFKANIEEFLYWHIKGTIQARQMNMVARPQPGDPDDMSDDGRQGDNTPRK
jgi:hypothetical protein